MIKSWILNNKVLAIMGTSSLAGSNLIAGLMLLSLSSSTEYGGFAFFQVMIGLVYGVSNALFSSPTLHLLAEKEPEQVVSISSYWKANIIFSVVVGILVFFVFYSLNISFSSAITFSVASTLLSLRWFLRNVFINLHEIKLSFYSDSSLSAAMLLLLAVYGNQLSLFNCGLVIIIGATISIVLSTVQISKGALKLQFWSKLHLQDLREFKKSYNQVGKHSVIGVASTEVCVNAHSYLITAVYGASAFAPIGAAMMVLRPITLINLALSQVYRAMFVKQLKFVEEGAVKKSLRHNVIFVLCFLLLNYIAIYLFLNFDISRDLLFSKLNYEDLVLAVLLCSVLIGIRTIRTPYSTLLQALGKFKELARVTLYISCLVLASVVILILNGFSLGSLVGAIAGEFIVLLSLVFLSREYSKQNMIKK